MIGIQVLYSGVLIGLTLHGCTPSLYRWGAPEAEIFVFKFLLWPGFESRTLQSNGRERYHSTTAPPRVKDLHKVITWRLERGFEPTTLRSKGFDFTNASPRPPRFVVYI